MWYPFLFLLSLFLLLCWGLFFTIRLNIQDRDDIQFLFNIVKSLLVSEIQLILLLCIFDKLFGLLVILNDIELSILLVLVDIRKLLALLLHLRESYFFCTGFSDLCIFLQVWFTTRGNIFLMSLFWTNAVLRFWVWLQLHFYAWIGQIYRSYHLFSWNYLRLSDSAAILRILGRNLLLIFKWGQVFIRFVLRGRLDFIKVIRCFALLKWLFGLLYNRRYFNIDTERTFVCFLLFFYDIERFGLIGYADFDFLAYFFYFAYLFVLFVLQNFFLSSEFVDFLFDIASKFLLLLLALFFCLVQLFYLGCLNFRCSILLKGCNFFRGRWILRPLGFV